MVFQTHPRFFLAMSGSVVLASMLACGGGFRPRKSTQVGEDVIVSGSMASVTDSVPGDVILAGRGVVFQGAAGGDYLGVGSQQTIGGRIHGSARAVGGEIHVTAVVDRNATIGGGNVALDSAADIGRNAYLAGENVEVIGTVRGGVLVSGGKVVLNGIIGGDAEVRARALTVGPHAVITGNLRYRVPAGKVHIDPAARISGTVTALPVSGGRWGIKYWLWMLGVILAGVVAVALLPGFTSDAAAILAKNPVRSGLVGLGWFILVPIAVILAAITIIGLPLALLTIALYAVGVCFSAVPFSIWLGRLLPGARTRTGRQGLILNFVIGEILLLLVGMIPFVGAIVTGVAGCLGFGAIMLGAKALRERQAV